MKEMKSTLIQQGLPSTVIQTIIRPFLEDTTTEWVIDV